MARDINNMVNLKAKYVEDRSVCSVCCYAQISQSL